jgi:hypothetical protein
MLLFFTVLYYVASICFLIIVRQIEVGEYCSEKKRINLAKNVAYRRSLLVATLGWRLSMGSKEHTSVSNPLTRVQARA